ncbi:MAG: hypothetical protein IJS21_05770 [Deltaproteobacteria bacterium]|nr:hypothetical protein [Deltaproteobacteria bacterium]
MENFNDCQAPPTEEKPVVGRLDEEVFIFGEEGNAKKCGCRFLQAAAAKAESPFCGETFPSIRCCTFYGTNVFFFRAQNFYQTKYEYVNKKVSYAKLF